VKRNSQHDSSPDIEEMTWFEERAKEKKGKNVTDRRYSQQSKNGGRSRRQEEVNGRPRRQEELTGRNGRKQGWSTKKKVGVIALSIALALLLTATGVLAHFINRLTTDVITEGFTPEQVSIPVDHYFMFDKDNFLQVAIFGDDEVGDEQGRTDTIIIASLNLETSEVRLVSVFRDTLLELDNGNLDKAAHAYAFGGSQGAVSMLNRNLDLNIQHYVTVDFTAAALVVDAIGGVEIDVLWEEIDSINGLSAQMVLEGQLAWDSGLTIPPMIYQSGVHNLCGVQALAYMRIRKVGNNDFRRTERQREVIELALAGAQSASLGTINEIINHVFDNLSTNFSVTEILAYGRDINRYHIGESAGFPFNLTTKLLPRSGDSVIPTTLESNVIQLHYFLFGTENYIPSATVKRISNDISNLTGTTVDSAIDIDGEWEFVEPPYDYVIPEEPGDWEQEETIPPGETDIPEEPHTPEEPSDLPDEIDIPEETESSIGNNSIARFPFNFTFIKTYCMIIIRL
jgi:LCP family protein required for cell wall assembly